jgi:hypothetical protein
MAGAGDGKPSAALNPHQRRLMDSPNDAFFTADIGIGQQRLEPSNQVDKLFAIAL